VKKKFQNWKVKESCNQVTQRPLASQPRKTVIYWKSQMVQANTHLKIGKVSVGQFPEPVDGAGWIPRFCATFLKQRL
jgi:hypothetical protein